MARGQYLRRHPARVESAVNALAPLLWDAAAPHVIAWLRRTLRAVKPQVETIIIDTRAFEREKLFVEMLIQHITLVEPPPVLRVLVERFTERLTAGFLPRDPRRAELIRYSEEVLERSVGAWWRTQTSPKRLAIRLVNMKARGLSYTEMTRQIAAQYKAEYHTAEAAVRTTYNASANYSAMMDLREAGFTRKKWITSQDSRVRRGKNKTANHREAEGQIVPLDEPFIVSGELLMFPGDQSRGASAGNVISCRCTIVGVD